MNKHIDEKINAAHGESRIVWNSWSGKIICAFRYRCGPVPRVSNGYWPRGTYYRHVRCHRHLKENARTELDGFRSYFKGKNAPINPWDEYPRERHKCWKKYRQTQYKA